MLIAVDGLIWASKSTNSQALVECGVCDKYIPEPVQDNLCQGLGILTYDGIKQTREYNKYKNYYVKHKKFHKEIVDIIENSCISLSSELSSCL